MRLDVDVSYNAIGGRGKGRERLAGGTYVKVNFETGYLESMVRHNQMRSHRQIITYDVRV
jgi:hypothetical protein